MTQKAFDEAIKAIMDKAKSEGWEVDQIADYAREAVIEWENEQEDSAE